MTNQTQTDDDDIETIGDPSPTFPTGPVETGPIER